MAKIRAHGSIIGTVEYMTYAKRYMSDGVVLKNSGFGWKWLAKVKPGITPQHAYQTAERALTDMIAVNPAAGEYRKALHALAGISKRWRLHLAVQKMPDDPDGVWSEACDGYGDNVHADVDDLVALCAAYRLMMASRVPAPAQLVVKQSDESMA
jgi:hypothetical protein